MTRLEGFKEWWGSDDDEDTPIHIAIWNAACEWQRKVDIETCKEIAEGIYSCPQDCVDAL